MKYRYIVKVKDDYIILYDRLDKIVIYKCFGFYDLYGFIKYHHILFNDVYFNLSLKILFDKFIDESSLSYRYLNNFRNELNNKEFL